MASLRSISPSLLGGPVRVPGMSKVKLPHDQRQFLEDQALEIFTNMVNAGATLRQALAAIYLSGMSAAREAVK